MTAAPVERSTHEATPGAMSTLPRALSQPAVSARVVRSGPGTANRRAKRVLDVTVAAIALVVLAPLMLAIALLVTCTSRGPVLYRQVRIGAHGKPFTMLKFRSMRHGAEREAPTLGNLNEATGPLFKIRHDPRITRVGRSIRRASLDELPQLVNVLTGAMSLVGPRPALPAEVRRFAPHEHQRHLVSPGLTGLAQVNGRSDLEWSRAIELDLSYVDHCSLWLDLRILARTIPAVIRGSGAY